MKNRQLFFVFLQICSFKLQINRQMLKSTYHQSSIRFEMPNSIIQDGAPHLESFRFDFSEEKEEISESAMLMQIISKKSNLIRILRNPTIKMLFATSGKAEEPQNLRAQLSLTMRIFKDFVTPEEEDALIREIDPYIKRLRYEYSHWDDAIHAYRETERAKWNEENTKIIDRVREKAFPPGTPQLGLVHVLDLAPEGRIKPHIDSTRFCGDVIAGISLLTDSVMRLSLPGDEGSKEDFLLPRRSLYIMSGIARQKYNHEILGPDESIFEGKKIFKDRRISVICRSEPDYQNH